jgi:phage terminase small subunit
MSKPLNTRQKKFVDNYITRGMSISESVRRAGYSIKSGRSEDAGSYGCKLLRQDRVKAYVAKLREKAFAKDVLSVAEKRAFLARSVRADLTSGKVDGDLVQELKEEVDSEGNVRRTVKVVNKLDAIKEDNKMVGVYEDDKVAANPFLFLITLGKGGGSLAESPALPASPAFSPAESVTIEAETLPA